MKKNTLTVDPIMLEDELWMRREKPSPNCRSRFFENQTAETEFSVFEFWGHFGSVFRKPVYFHPVLHTLLLWHRYTCDDLSRVISLRFSLVPAVPQWYFVSMKLHHKRLLQWTMYMYSMANWYNSTTTLKVNTGQHYYQALQYRSTYSIFTNFGTCGFQTR